MGRIYDIGPFRLDADLGALTRAGAPMTLGARAAAVLTVLVEHVHQFVSKERLIELAWPDVIVEESNLPVQVHAIRRVLAQAPGADRWIETFARRGYRFVGPVCAAGDAHGDSEAEQSNLPQALTSFIGRERDLVEIKRLLPSKRLITVVGTGGIGKTRLALQTAVEVTSAYRDGVRFIDLGSLRDAALVPAAVARALGVQERSGKPLSAALCERLRPLQILLILDNCEHLLDACAELVDGLLKGAAQTTIMATSREPIRAAGEQIYALQPLSLPQLGSTLDAVHRSEAVQLLVERVRQQLPDFELSAERASSIVELCIHLDGIPLALELAAARARSLSIEEINARLGDRFRLLTGGARTALPRQQTLRATLDWSHDLLDNDQRAVLRRLAVFEGGATLDAMCAVASDQRIDALAVVDRLAQLVARSLIVADTSGAVRYRLLETTHAYAREKLLEAGEHAETARRHAEYFATFFAHADDDWLRMPNAQWRGVYLSDVENVRIALDRTIASGGLATGTDRTATGSDESAIGIALASAAASIWSESGLPTEGLRRLRAALTAASPRTPALHQARLWFWLGVLNNQDSMAALDACRHAIEQYRLDGDTTFLGFALMRAGGHVLYLGDTRQAAALFAEAEPFVEASRLAPLRAELWLMLGTLKWFTGDLAGARVELEKSAALAREIGCLRVMRGVLANLAEVAWLAGDLDAALAGYRDATDFARQAPRERRADLGMYLTNLAGVHVERGELDAALAAAREGLPIRREFGSGASALDHLALRVALIGNVAAAARIAGHADHAYSSRAAERQPNEARARARLATLLAAELASETLAGLLDEGTRMSEEAACRLAVEQ